MKIVRELLFFTIVGLMFGKCNQNNTDPTPTTASLQRIILDTALENTTLRTFLVSNNLMDSVQEVDTLPGMYEWSITDSDSGISMGKQSYDQVFVDMRFAAWELGANRAVYNDFALDTFGIYVYLDSIKTVSKLQDPGYQVVTVGATSNVGNRLQQGYKVPVTLGRLLRNKNVGDRFRYYLPSRYAYGINGNTTPNIPTVAPSAIIVVEFEILDYYNNFDISGNKVR